MFSYKVGFHLCFAVQKFSSVFTDSESEPGDDGRVPSEPVQDQGVTTYFDQGPTPMRFDIFVVLLKPDKCDQQR